MLVFDCPTYQFNNQPDARHGFESFIKIFLTFRSAIKLMNLVCVEWSDARVVGNWE